MSNLAIYRRIVQYLSMPDAAAGSSFLAVPFQGLWRAEFHAEKEMGAKLVGLPGSAVAVARMLGEDALSAVLGKKAVWNRRSIVS